MGRWGIVPATPSPRSETWQRCSCSWPGGEPASAVLVAANFGSARTVMRSSNDPERVLDAAARSLSASHAEECASRHSEAECLASVTILGGSSEATWVRPVRVAELSVGTERDLVGLPPVDLVVVVDPDPGILAPNYRADEDRVAASGTRRVGGTAGPRASRLGADVDVGTPRIRGPSQWRPDRVHGRDSAKTGGKRFPARRRSHRSRDRRNRRGPGPRGSRRGCRSPGPCQGRRSRTLAHPGSRPVHGASQAPIGCAASERRGRPGARRRRSCGLVVGLHLASRQSNR